MAKKSFMLFWVGICLAGFIYAGGGGEAAGTKAGGIELSFGHFENPGHDLHTAMGDFVQKANEQAQGAVHMTVYPASQLGSEREMIEQVLMGTLDIAEGSPAGWSVGAKAPEMGVFTLPFMYDSIETQKKLIYAVAFEEIRKILIPKGARPFMMFSNGIRSVLAKTKPIKTIEDFRGLKIRSPESSIYVDTFNNLGASVVIMPWAEVYTGMTQGVCDAAEADANGLISIGLTEVGKFYSYTNHLGDFKTIAMNENKWQSLSADMQKLIQDIADKCSAEQIDKRAEVDKAAEKTFIDAGIQVNRIVPAEWKRMRQAVQPMYDEYLTKYNMGDMLKRISEIINQ